jgi:hypothetical protein
MPVRPAGPTARPLMTSFGLHVLALILLLLVPVGLRRSAPPRELDVVFRRTPPPVEVPAPAALPRGETLAARPRPEPAGPSAPPNVPLAPKPIAPEDPTPLETTGAPDPGIIAEVEPPPPPKKVVSAGLLAFKDEFARLAQDKVEPRLGADARYGSGDDVARGAPTRSMLTTQTPGTSGGINSGALPRNVGGGRGAGGGQGGMPGVQVGHPSSPIARIGGDDRPLSRGPGPSRTDEEIQIVFDRYKSSFYRLYNLELREDPSLQGQMVLKLTIEPDGSVSMCVLQSTDMNAPQLAEQVVGRVRTINFGAKEGVQALTIVYPIDFLPAV